MTARLLPVVEWDRLVADGIEPFATYGLPPVEHREHWRMIVVEDAGHILGCSCLHSAVLNDWYITPSTRRNPVLVPLLWRETKKVLDEGGIELIHATVQDRQLEVQAMVERLGYVPAEGKLYVLYVPNCVLNEKEQVG